MKAYIFHADKLRIAQCASFSNVNYTDHISIKYNLLQFQILVAVLWNQDGLTFHEEILIFFGL